MFAFRWRSCGMKPEYSEEIHLSDLVTTWSSHMPMPGIEPGSQRWEASALQLRQPDNIYDGWVIHSSHAAAIMYNFRHIGWFVLIGSLETPIVKRCKQVTRLLFHMQISVNGKEQGFNWVRWNVCETSQFLNFSLCDPNAFITQSMLMPVLRDMDLFPSIWITKWYV